MEFKQPFLLGIFRNLAGHLSRVSFDKYLAVNSFDFCLIKIRVGLYSFFLWELNFLLLDFPGFGRWLFGED